MTRKRTPKWNGDPGWLREPHTSYDEWHARTNEITDRNFDVIGVFDEAMWEEAWSGSLLSPEEFVAFAWAPAYAAVTGDPAVLEIASSMQAALEPYRTEAIQAAYRRMPDEDKRAFYSASDVPRKREMLHAYARSR